MNKVVLNRHPRAEYLGQIMTTIDAILGHSVPGTFSVLEVDQLSDYLNPLFRNAGFHMNIYRGGIEEMSPSHIYELMRQPDCKHLIWLSKETCEDSDVHFAWIYTHEVRHLLMSEEDYRVSVLGAFLYRNLGSIVEGASILEIPTELACELTALSVTEGMFGKDIVAEYLEKKNPGHLAQLKARVREYSITDVREECCALLRRHVTELRRLFREEQDQGLKHQIDIFGICAE